MDGADTRNALDACVSGVNAVYQLFMASIVGEFHRATSNVTKLTARDFAKSCVGIQKLSLEAIDHALNDGLSRIETLLKETDATDFAIIKADVIKTLKAAYKAQTLLDINAARSDIFRYTLAVVQRTDMGITPISAMAAANKSVRFSFIDRAGKKWNSGRHITTVTRYEILNGIYFSFVLSAESAGVSEIKLSDDRVINVSEVGQYSHPNSKLMPIQVVR